MPSSARAAERHDATLEREMAALLDEAPRTRRDGGRAPGALARAVIAMMRGSLLTWSAIGQHTAPEQLGARPISKRCSVHTARTRPARTRRAAPPRKPAAAPRAPLRPSRDVPRPGHERPADLVGFSRGMYKQLALARPLQLLVDAGEGLQLALGSSVSRRRAGYHAWPFGSRARDCRASLPRADSARARRTSR